MTMDDSVLRPAAGVQEEQTRVNHAPWLERKERGFLRAFFSTIGMSLVNQGKLIRGLPATPAIGSAWWFAIIVTVAVFGLVIIPFTALVAFPILVSGGGAGGMSRGISTFSWFALSMIGISLGLLLVWALVTHGLLAITGPKKGGLGRTMEAFGYSAGANVLTALPCVGIYFGWIWWVISATLLVKEAQGVSGGRAALVTLPFPLACVGGVVMLFVWAIASMPVVTTTPGTFGVTTTPPGQNAANPQVYEASAVTEALLAFRFQSGALPSHALELVADQDLVASDFVSMDSNTGTADIPVGRSTLAMFERLPVIERQKAVAAATASLPNGVVAHRLGDFVFTYHGLPDEAAGDLWVVVMAVDPATNPQGPMQDIVVGQNDGTMLEIHGEQVTTMLSIQNQRRAEVGLPPLPDPRTITHQKPAVSETSTESDGA